MFAFRSHALLSIEATQSLARRSRITQMRVSRRRAAVLDRMRTLTSDIRVCFSSPDNNVRLREGNVMHGKTNKLHATPAGAQPSPKHRHGHAPAESGFGSKLMLLPVLLVA